MREEDTGTNAPLNGTSSIIDSVTKPEKRSVRNKRLALIGLALFLLGLCSFCGLFFFSLANHVGEAPTQLPVSKEAISNLTIKYFSPNMLEVGTPTTFSVSISNAELQVDVTGASQSVLSATPIPNGTPDAPLSQAFGPGYMVFVYAQLDVSPASKFDLPQLRQDSQSLEQQQPIFSWTITPKETTQAVITITITGQWKPISTGNEIDIPLGEHRQNYDVASTPTTPGASIIRALTTLGSAFVPVFTTFGGIGLTIPWILDQIRKKRNKPKQSRKKRTGRGRKPG